MEFHAEPSGQRTRNVVLASEFGAFGLEDPDFPGFFSHVFYDNGDFVGGFHFDVMEKYLLGIDFDGA